jgi:transposase
MKELMAGIDLHSNNIMVGIVDGTGKRLAHQKLPCELKRILEFLAPFKSGLQRLAVESTYNWYWLVDGLQAAGYPVVLANPARITQYSGLKHADDKSDAFFLAELLRLNILPTGYVYDAQRRPVRDLLRRRMSLVQQRTALMLSFKSLFTRTTGGQMSLSQLKTLEVKEAKALRTSGQSTEHGPELNVFWTRQSGLGAAKIGTDKDGKAFRERKAFPAPALEPDG